MGFIDPLPVAVVAFCILKFSLLQFYKNIILKKHSYFVHLFYPYFLTLFAVHQPSFLLISISQNL